MKAATVKEIIELTKIIENKSGEKTLMCGDYQVFFDGEELLLKSPQQDYFHFYPNVDEIEKIADMCSEINNHNAKL